MSTMLQQLNAEMEGLVEQPIRGLVQVRSGKGGVGAGTVWHPDGLVLTNAHVVRRGHLQVTLWNGTSMLAKVLAQDPGHDLAALAVDATSLPTVEVGQSMDLRPGQWVLALGHPWGSVGAATAGVVIGAGSEWHGVIPSGQEWIAVSLHLRPGYSGGPLIDTGGRLVGVNTMMAGPDVGIAVPVHVVKAFLRQSLGSQNMLAAD